MGHQQPNHIYHPPRTVNQGYTVQKVSHFRHLLLCKYCDALKVCNLKLGKTNLDRVNQLRGHTFMTSTLRWGSGPMWTSTQKIKIIIHCHHPVFSRNEVSVLFTRISSLEGIKPKNISAI